MSAGWCVIKLRLCRSLTKIIATTRWGGIGRTDLLDVLFVLLRQSAHSHKERGQGERERERERRMKKVRDYDGQRNERQVLLFAPLVYNNGFLSAGWCVFTFV